MAQTVPGVMNVNITLNVTDETKEPLHNTHIESKGMLMTVCAVASRYSPVLAHHEPDKEGRYCLGCDMGCSCEAADWPCSTVRLVLRQSGVTFPDYFLRN